MIIAAFRPQLASVVTILASLIASPAFSTETQAEPEIIGRRVPNFVLSDASGQEVALSDFNDAKTLVVVFLGTQCLFLDVHFYSWAPGIEIRLPGIEIRGPGGLSFLFLAPRFLFLDL